MRDQQERRAVAARQEIGLRRDGERLFDGFRRQAHHRRERLRRLDLRVLRRVVQRERRDLVQHRGRDRGEDAPVRAALIETVDHFVAGRQNSSIECTSPLLNTKGPKNAALTKAFTAGWIRAEPALLSEKQTSQLVVAGVVVSALWQA